MADPVRETRMGKRVSYSLLDPWLTTPIKSLYPFAPIPSAVPPEAVVGVGHAFAISAGVGFAYSTGHWWGALLVVIGVVGNHVADVLDGTHARATQQCRNGGELLDHFVDPLSFSYWIAGLAVSCGRLELGLAGVVCLYATAVLVNIKAKMVGEFTLSRFGPTEFKTLLVVYGLGLLGAHSVAAPVELRTAALVFLVVLLAAGMVQLLGNLIRAVHDVNAHGAPPDTTEWNVTRATARPDD